MKPARLLVADDHPIIRQGLAALFAPCPAEWEICATAANGQEALRATLIYRPDIVIMDYKMPLLDGLAAARQIKKRRPAIEVLIFSGASSPHILLEIFHSKVCGALLKSEAAEELFPALGALRRHHRFRSRGITERCEKIMVGDAPFRALTDREREMMRLIVAGLSIKQIANKLGVSVDTIDTHRTNLYQKLGLHSASDVVRYAFEHGLVGFGEEGEATKE